jgi:hypothetical protein
MNDNIKHRITTYIVFVVIWVIAILNTDGYTDSWNDTFIILYPVGIFWVYLRELGFLRFK